jgi:hypothetical protein
MPSMTSMAKMTAARSPHDQIRAPVRANTSQSMFDADADDGTTATRLRTRKHPSRRILKHSTSQ